MIPCLYNTLTHTHTFRKIADPNMVVFRTDSGTHLMKGAEYFKFFLLNGKSNTSLASDIMVHVEKRREKAIYISGTAIKCNSF